MNLRNSIRQIFGRVKNYVSSRWQEVGGYMSRFSSFGTDIYANEIVRACIRTLAEHSSKANVKVLRGDVIGDKRLQQIIEYQPNMYMNGKDFLYKVRTLLEIHNVVFIYIMRDNIGKCVGLYAMPTARLEALDVGGRLYIKFTFISGISMTHSWDDLAILRKDYNTSDIWGDSNEAILTSLDLLTTTNEGMANAIKSTANLRGVLTSTKAMLSDEDVKRNKERFVGDYMSLANTSGIASLDATQKFEPITLQPQIANYKNIEELRNNVYRYFGVNEEVILSKAVGDDWEAFYESKLEPFLLALGLELTNKVFTTAQKSNGYKIIFEANRLQYATAATKLKIVTQMFDRGFITHNQGLEIFNMAPVKDGDKRYVRKEYAEIDKLSENEGFEYIPKQKEEGDEPKEEDDDK